MLLISLTGGVVHADPVIKLMTILRKASDYKQRLTAALALARRKDLRAVPALMAALGDRNTIVQGVVASVLGKLGDQRAKPALARLLGNTKSGFLRSQLKEALLALAAAARRKPGSTMPPGSKAPAGRMQLEGALGTLDEHAATQGTNARLPAATACFTKAFNDKPYLAGKLGLRFRVTRDGKVKWLLLERSDLGALAVERCILQAMTAATFEKPDGGEAEFTLPLAFGGGDPVSTLDPQTSELAQLLRKKSTKLLRKPGTRRAKLVAPAGLLVTLYVSSAGVITSSGFSANGVDISAAFADTLAANLAAFEVTRGAPPSGHGKLIWPFSCRSK
ncbi:MAG: HEAT repeat domain-containing protein [Deltaproteobacteria bacterium]|nr:HEAT repeat domain-containing protein [Deltaproteobacteria bacterium]